MKNKVMIDNQSKFTTEDVMEYLSGTTTKLRDLISVKTFYGTYYDNIVINDV